MSAPAAPPSMSFESVPGGSVVIGLDQAGDVLAALGPTAFDEGAYCAPVFVIEPDEAVAGTPDAARVCAHPRVRAFVGASAGESFIADRRSNLSDMMPTRFHLGGERVGALARGIAEQLRAVLIAQDTETQAIRERLSAQGRERGMSYWDARFREIAGGAAPRVMIVTSRFTTFLRYSAGDLAEAFGEIGADVRVVMHTDIHASITPLFMMRQTEEFDPDLIVITNYTRAHRSEIFPPGRPHVCWVQDAMNHMFQTPPELPGELDFVAGHLYPGAKMLDGHRDGTTLEFLVPVSSRKFHDGPVADADRHRCDIAYVSHQSEPAERFRDRMIAEFGVGQRSALLACYQRVRDAVDAWATSLGEPLLESALNELLEGLGRAGDGVAERVMRSQYVYPLAEKLLRHQMLEWAARITERRGLSLRIHGNGWDEHPTLRAYARPALAHGEDLRASYQTALVHLHASALGCGHQRVIECAMSGGLPISRRLWDEQHRHDWARMTEFMADPPPPDATLVKWRWPALAIDKHPELAAIIADRARMIRPVNGWDHEPFEGVYARVRNDDYFKYWDAPLPPEHLRSLSVFRDPLELNFSTEEELEALIVRAIEDPDWRAEAGRDIARRAKATKSMTCFARALLDTVGGRLCGAWKNCPDRETGARIPELAATGEG